MPENKSKNYQFLMAQGYLAQQKGNINQALDIYKKILNIQPSYFDALSCALAILDSHQNYKGALDLLQRAVIDNPDDFFIHNNLGKVFDHLGELELSVQSYQKAIALNPGYAEGYFNLGNSYFQLEKLELAVKNYELSIKLDSKDSMAYFNLGNTLRQLNKRELALAQYERAIELEPNSSDIWVNHGSILSELQLYGEALSSFDKAIQINYFQSESWLNKGVVLNKVHLYVEAIKCFDYAIQLAPHNSEIHSNRGIALYGLKRYDDALSSYKEALDLNPNEKYLLGNYVYTKMIMSEWDHLSEDIDKITARIQKSQQVIFPFALLGMSDNSELHLKAAQIWSKDQSPSLHSSLGATKEQAKKIRVGYFSADFYNHATTYLMAEFFELHDKNQFEIYAFSFGPNIQDESRSRLNEAFDQFYDVSNMSDKDVAKFARDKSIDIAVDLKGYTKDLRTNIFAHGAAPIQVNYLGYPGTMGVDYIDYIIADPVILPQSMQMMYSEKIVYLPNSYQVNDSKRQISDRIFSKAELGLPDDGFVFCCFNNNYKINPTVFDSWARILSKVDRSVLWLLEDNKWAKTNLIKEAVSRGIEAERLIFADRMELSQHLGRHRMADLFLDTWPYNAHTTASDALWAGVPVLTYLGNNFAGRVSASLLTAIDLPELITTSRAKYEFLAIELALNPKKLKALKEKLKINRMVKPLYDTKLFTINMESAYAKIYERYKAGLAPDNIYIQ